MNLTNRIPVQSLIIASGMTACVLVVAPGGPVLILLSAVLLIVGLAMRITGWISNSSRAAAVLVFGYILYLVILGGTLLLIAAGPPRIESCIGYLFLTSGVTLIFLWLPLGIGLLLGRWLAPSNEPAEQTADGKTPEAPQQPH